MHMVTFGHSYTPPFVWAALNFCLPHTGPTSLPPPQISADMQTSVQTGLMTEQLRKPRRKARGAPFACLLPWPAGDEPVRITCSGIAAWYVVIGAFLVC